MKLPLRFKLPTTDLWHVGIVHRPVGDLLQADALASTDITWLPEPGPFRFIADPFGIWRDGKLWIFVEALDYRVKRGEIHYYCYDAAFNFLESGVALRTPFHLSYPTIIEDNGEIYMLPEAHRSGRLTLYKAMCFPDQWEPVAMVLDQPAIDSSVIQHQGRWWMFYALPGGDKRALRELHVAYADQLMGPWQACANNPVRDAIDSARPGGRPFVHAGDLYLPTQDCTHDYGGALNLLRIETLETTRFAANVARHVSPEMLRNYTDGLHTLTGVGAVTLIDGKRVHRSHARRLIDLQRRLRRLIRLA